MDCVILMLQLRKLKRGEPSELCEFSKLVSVKFLSQGLFHWEHGICTSRMNKSLRLGFLIQPDSKVYVTNDCAVSLHSTLYSAVHLWGTISIRSSVLPSNWLPSESDPSRPPGSYILATHIFCGLQIQHRFPRGPKIKGMWALTLFLRILLSRGGRGIRKMTFTENM